MFLPNRPLEQIQCWASSKQLVGYKKLSQTAEIKLLENHEDFYYFPFWKLNLAFKEFNKQATDMSEMGPLNLTSFITTRNTAWAVLENKTVGQQKTSINFLIILSSTLKSVVGFFKRHFT